MRDYLLITSAYWGFTITDGAIRMLIVLYFHQIGYSPMEIAFLFLFYEFFGVVTNLVGGWLGAHIGLNKTMHIGMALQVLALVLLTVPDSMLGVAYVMFAQALSGIAKDLNKMSAKASVKLMLPDDADGSKQLFRWVSVLTGSKNSLKGAGFFIGGALLAWIGFRGALWSLAGFLLVILVITWILLPNELGKMKYKPKFSQVFSKSPAINWLSAARFFLFGSRDVWFVVALPVFLAQTLQWTHTEVGGFLAAWVIGYGVVQASVPGILRKSHPDGASSTLWVFILSAIPAAIALVLSGGYDPQWVLVVGLSIFGIVFAINSAVHSFLILDYSDHEGVSMNVGFYYMANAGGRLIGTVLSGWSYQALGLVGGLWISFSFVFLAGVLSIALPRHQH